MTFLGKDFSGVIIKVPAKVILFGEHAVVHGHKAIVATINKYMIFHCKISKQVAPSEFCSLSFENEDSLDPRILKLIHFASNYIKYSDSQIKAANAQLSISVASEFPAGSGLGASSAICVGISTAALLFSNEIDSQLNEIHLTRIEKLAYDMELVMNSNSSGLDTSACVWGGVRLFEGSTKKCKPLENYIKEVVIMDTGEKHDTAEAVKATQAIPHIADIYRDIGVLASKAVEEIIENGSELPKLMEKNNILLEKAGVGCSKSVKISSRVKGAKISGAGKGGILVSLSISQDDESFLRENGFHFFKSQVVSHGVRIVEPDLPLYLAALGTILEDRFKQHPLKIPRIGYCTSPSNIAIIKYWGKRPEFLQMSLNDSISYTIAGFRSFTKVKLDAYDENSALSGDDSRALKFLKRINPCKGFNMSYASFNNFPSSCGIASSASGFNALVGAVVDCLNLQEVLSTEDLQYFINNWTRIGSGSACRSTFDGFVRWNHQSITQVISAKQCLQIKHCVIVFNPMPKEVSSSDGHRSVDTSIFQPFRKHFANFGVSKIVKLLQQTSFFNWSDFVYIMEADAMIMHSVMVSSKPSAKYLTNECMKFVESFMAFRDSTAIRAGFTIDAGPNPHLLYHEEDEEKLLRWLRKYPFWVKLLINKQQIGGMLLGEQSYDHYMNKNLLDNIANCRAIVVSGKRYSGKSWFTDEISKRFNLPQFALSDDIKRQYCALHNIDPEEMLRNRELKEAHREKMVHYCEDQIARNKYVWDWSLWNRILKRECKLFVVSDLRREPDLQFFRRMTDCLYVRVTCKDKVRKQRGWIESPVDHLPSEIGLDDAQFDLQFSSDTSMNDPGELERVCDAISAFLSIS